jgi:acetyl-CoA C-acetyltransferase
MRDVAIIGVGTTQFGRAQWSLLKMMCESSHDAIVDSGIDKKKIDALYVANMASGRSSRQLGLASALVDRLNLTPIAADTIENGPASGGSAIKHGVMAVASGWHDTVLVVGGERLREVNGLEATETVSLLSHRYAEYVYGVTLPALAGLFARLYMDKYGITAEHLALAAIKNHANGARNEKAHLKEMVPTLEGILTGPQAANNNPYMADPLRYFDMCPVSDGSSAVLLCPAEMANDFAKTPVRVAGMGQATDCHAVHERPDPTVLSAVELAAKQAFGRAKLAPKDVGVCEMHDAFSILEFAEMEACGFYEKGGYKYAVESGENKIDGSLPVNPSGGLKSRGHPVGNTGVSQIVELCYQLRGDAPGYQVTNDPQHGFAVNFGGFGNNVVATVLSKGVK